MPNAVLTILNVTSFHLQLAPKELVSLPAPFTDDGIEADAAA
jgi:hypothetical protein